jgi:hypothetical protein
MVTARVMTGSGVSGIMVCTPLPGMLNSMLMPFVEVSHRRQESPNAVNLASYLPSWPPCRSRPGR